MNFLNDFLARLFDGFKASNPKVAAAILLFLGSLIYWADNGLSQVVGYDLSQWVQYVSMVLAALTGSRTTSFLTTVKPTAKK